MPTKRRGGGGGGSRIDLHFQMVDLWTCVAITYMTNRVNCRGSLSFLQRLQLIVQWRTQEYCSSVYMQHPQPCTLSGPVRVPSGTLCFGPLQKSRCGWLWCRPNKIDKEQRVNDILPSAKLPKAIIPNRKQNAFDQCAAPLLELSVM